MGTHPENDSLDWIAGAVRNSFLTCFVTPVLQPDAASRGRTDERGGPS